jgi:hypothetical protein
VTRWLTTLANHLRACQTREGGSGSDINVHELWTAAGHVAPRYIAATLHALLTAVPLALAAWYLLNVGNLIRPLPAIGVGVVIVALVFTWATRVPVALYRFDLGGLRTATGRRQLAIWITAGLSAGLIGGLCVGVAARAIGYTDGLRTWPAVGVALGLTIGLAAGLRHRPSTISHPRQVVTQGITHDLTVLIGAGLTGALAVGLTGWLTARLTSGGLSAVAQAARHKLQTDAGIFSAFPGHLAVGLAAGLTGGLALGLAAGAAANAGSPWLRYLVATGILARRRDLPPRPAPFLDWAYGAGLLRLAGISPQFRHRELQDHLTTYPDRTTKDQAARHQSALPSPAALTPSMPRFGVLSRQRTVNKRSKGPTAVPGDQAPDLQLPGGPTTEPC